jgi:D-glycero-alpha-D-manno-heptose 1-phosphate guanylyltransferase
MEVIILSGGQGTRIKSALSNLPKPMAPILGRPFLEYILDHLSASRINRVHMAIGYLGHKIEQHFGGVYKNIRLTYSKEETPLGTGGAIVQAARLIDDAFFIVMNGDSYLDFNIDELLSKFSKKNENMIVVAWVPDVSRYGKVEFNDYIKSFSEKGETGPGYINTGIYILNKNIFEDITDEVFSLEQHLMKSIHEYDYTPYVVDASFIDIGTLKDLARTDQFFSGYS